MTRVESFLSDIAAAIHGLVRILSGMVWLDGGVKCTVGVLVILAAAGVFGYAAGVARRRGS